MTDDAIVRALEAQERADRQVPAYDTEPAEEAERREQEPEPGVVFSIEDLVGAKIVTATGRARGVVAEVLVSAPPELRIVALVVGASGWLHRLRIASRLPRLARAARSLDEVPWEAIDRWDGLRIVLRPGEEDEGVVE